MGQPVLATMASVADTIDDYRLVRPLGTSGAAFVAHDLLLDRAVVLTFLPLMPDAQAERLALARLFAQVSHPNLGRVHRVREGGARPYIVEAFARGKRLDAVAAPLRRALVLELGRALAEALTTLHEVGASHGDVRAGRIVLSEEGTPRLVGIDRGRANAGDEAKRADVDALLALLRSFADGDLEGELASLTDVDHGVATAEELRRALDLLGRPTVAREAPLEDPYRGLRAFEQEHAAVFFGREREVAALLERLRAQPWLLIAGRSGTGKSSLARAGVAPLVAKGALGERGVWDVAMLVPGACPLDALAKAIGPLVGRGHQELAASLRRDPALAARLVGARRERGLLLIIDQLEEVITLASPEERAAFVAVIERFGALAPGVRAVFTLRGDFLDGLVGLGALGEDLARVAFVLPPMEEDGLRAAIVEPARARGVELETPAMVDTLVSEVRHHDEALPLLSFALSELWAARDTHRHVIPVAVLESLGGAVAALGRHGDTVLATLRDEERTEARRILLSLVTAAETRARPTTEDLVGRGGLPAKRALEALVRGRLVVAGETCELAHEALARAWPRLREWLAEASEARKVAERVARAAKIWERAGRPEDALYEERRLAELGVLGNVPLDGASEVFVAESRAAATRARRRRVALRVGGPLAVLALAAAVIGGLSLRERRQTHALLATHLREANAAFRVARELDAQLEEKRVDAFAHYDRGDAPGGEERWREVLALGQREAEGFAEASRLVGLALARDPRHREARALGADLAYAWLLAAERDHERDVARDLSARLAQEDDDGFRRARLAAPSQLRVTTVPLGGRVMLHEVHLEASGRRIEDRGRVVEAGAALELAPGSYLLEAKAEGRYPTRLPLLLRRGQSARVEIPMPAASHVPAGLVYVPAGVSIFGAADVEAVRMGLEAEPEHPAAVGAFLIGEHEVTYGEYLTYLASLPAAARATRTPHSPSFDLAYDGAGVPALTLGRTTARRGEPLCGPKRGVRRCQDWLRLPVLGISAEDAAAYATWLAGGLVRGARLCTHREWERAARGADGRLYAHGDELHAGEANFDETDGSDTEPTGTDEVGSHPVDRSPFGVLDMTGNVAEWVVAGDTRTALGGAWYVVAFYARAARRATPDDLRAGLVGIRVCAPAPKDPPAESSAPTSP